MATISSNYGEFYAYNIKAFCPICKNNFTGWYCPSCGLPKKNSKYTLSKYGSLDNCGQYHFRPEFSSFENIQLCDKCYTTNPSNAKYCRNCGKKFTSSKGIFTTEESMMTQLHMWLMKSFLTLLLPVKL